MKSKKLIITMILILFLTMVIGCSDDITNDALRINNNNQGNDEIIDNNPVNLPKGTIWYAGSYFVEFSGNNWILLRISQNYGSIGGSLNGDVTYGSFLISSYDGETLKILDYDKKEVSFTVIIDNNIMTISGLNAIKWTAPPYEPRFFGSWNKTYTKGN